MGNLDNRGQTSRWIIIGDIHGCLSELNELLEQVNLRKTDALIFCGDLVNKGPDSYGVVKRVLELEMNGHNVVVVKGNHEEKLLRFHHHEYIRVRTGKPNPMQSTEKVEQLYARLNQQQITSLSKARLFYRIKPLDLLVVHAGIPNNVQTLYVDRHTLNSREKKKQDQMLRIRFQDKDGRMVRLADTNPAIHTFWAVEYDGRFGHVVFGHQPNLSPKPQQYLNATGIDTGCVYGGYLTAAVYELGQQPQFIHVKATKKYAEFPKKRCSE